MSAMEQFIQKAATLVEALPYIRQFEGKTIVIKYGGSAMENPSLRRSTAEDVVLLRYVGMNPVVVHGGGPVISEALKRFGVESVFHQGLRITTGEAIKVVEMVLAGSINKEIVTLINRAGGKAVGLCGKDGRLLHAKKLTALDGTDLGHVGEITKVNPEIISVLSAADMIPVIAPIATDPEGGAWNVNADTAAGEIAAELHAEKLIFMTDTPGILLDPKDPTSLLRQLKHKDVDRLIADGVIGGGMIPKVKACITALDCGVNKTHIIDGRIPHAMLIEIFTDEGLGTLVTH